MPSAVLIRANFREEEKDKEEKDKEQTQKGTQRETQDRKEERERYVVQQCRPGPQA